MIGLPPIASTWNRNQPSGARSRPGSRDSGCWPLASPWRAAGSWIRQPRRSCRGRTSAGPPPHLRPDLRWDTAIFLVVQVLLLVAVFRFRGATPGRAAADPRQRGARDRLDDRPGDHPGVHRGPDRARRSSGPQAAPPKDALQVEVIGHQWWWEFRYPELGITTAQRAAHPGRARRSASTLEQRRRHPQLLGAEPRRQARRRSPAGPTTCGSRPTRRARTRASAPSSAAPRTRTCACRCRRDAGRLRRLGRPQQKEPRAPTPDRRARRPRRARRCSGRRTCVGLPHDRRRLGAGVDRPEPHARRQRAPRSPAATCPNTPENLARWIRHAPADASPASLMPEP